MKCSEYGKTGTYTFVDRYSKQYKMVMEDPEMLDQAKKMYDYVMEEISKGYNESFNVSPEEFEKVKRMTFEDFVRYMIYGDTETIELPKNSLYRLNLNGEYVYFVIK